MAREVQSNNKKYLADFDYRDFRGAFEEYVKAATDRLADDKRDAGDYKRRTDTLMVSLFNSLKSTSEFVPVYQSLKSGMNTGPFQVEVRQREADGAEVVQTASFFAKARLDKEGKLEFYATPVNLDLSLEQLLETEKGIRPDDRAAVLEKLENYGVCVCDLVNRRVEYERDGKDYLKDEEGKKIPKMRQNPDGTFSPQTYEFKEKTLMYYNPSLNYVFTKPVSDIKKKYDTIYNYNKTPKVFEGVELSKEQVESICAVRPICFTEGQRAQLSDKGFTVGLDGFYLFSAENNGLMLVRNEKLIEAIRSERFNIEVSSSARRQEESAAEKKEVKEGAAAVRKTSRSGRKRAEDVLDAGVKPEVKAGGHRL